MKKTWIMLSVVVIALVAMKNVQAHETTDYADSYDSAVVYQDAGDCGCAPVGANACNSYCCTPKPRCCRLGWRCAVRNYGCNDCDTGYGRCYAGCGTGRAYYGWHRHHGLFGRHHRAWRTVW